MRTKSGFLAALMLLMANGAFSAPVQWTLNNVQFSDGGTASGTFVYDATLNVYSSFNIATAVGGSFGGATYTNHLYSPQAPGMTFNWITSAGTSANLGFGSTWLGLTFSPGLSNSGNALLGGQEVLCLSDPPFGYLCNGNGITGQVLRTVVSGSVSAVPVPAALWLMGSAVGVLALVRRKSVPIAT